ncbi:uncharacterized protein [Rutidosis leptorrhynchoides]|uniref:uncharacterized protein n=1 Tax=Rutidosis leptorrhynchoides TaxID=125765 RepID=UPI003A9A562F
MSDDSFVSSGSITKISKLEFNDPLYLHPSDTSGASLITQKLKGTESYNVWSCAMKLVLQTKNKLGFIDGTCVRYEYEDDEVLLGKWDRCNSIVLTWILMSLSEDVYNGQIFSKTAESVWNELKETYDKIDASVTFNLYQKINSCCQSGQSLYDYYHKLNAMWRQFDDMVKIDDIVSANKSFQEHYQFLKLMQFLMGLDVVYVPIRSQILTSDPVPYVKTVFSIISRNESHRLHSTSSSNVNKMHSSAFNSKTTNFVNGWIIDSGVNQHTVSNSQNLNKVIDVSDLNLTVNHPNGTVAKILQMGNLRLSDNIELYDVLVIPQYCDLIQKILMGTGSEFDGLYFFDNNFNGGLPLYLWSECILTATYLINMLHSSVLSGRGSTKDDGNHALLYGSIESQSDGVPATSNDESIETQTVPGGNLTDNVFNCTPQLRKSSRETKIPVKFKDYVLNNNVKYNINDYLNYSKLGSENYCFVTSLTKGHEPKSFKEACIDQNWVNAMNDEMEALNRNNTWILTELPKDRKPVGSKWVYRIKYKSTGEIDRYKARVATVTARLFLSIACKNNWSLYQIDINNAFLYGDLTEDVYMTLPEGYFDKNDTRTDGINCVYLLVYVDDIIITESSEAIVEECKVFLKSKFKIKDLGKLKYFLGLELVKNDDFFVLCQRKYCLEVLAEFGVLASKPAVTPLESCVVFSNKDDFSGSDFLLENISEYQKLVGKLIYITLTRPYIAYSVHCLSQYMHAPLNSHMKAALRVLRYLKGSPGKGITIKKFSDLTFSGFVDSDYAKSNILRKSVTGFCIYFGGNLVSWKSKKQSTVSRSSTEAEYRALASISCEIIWILKVLKDLEVKVDLPVRILCDSKSALQIAKNPVFHERTKNFEVDLHFIREKIISENLETHLISSSENVSDIFTKGLNGTQHNMFDIETVKHILFSCQVAKDMWAKVLKWWGYNSAIFEYEDIFNGTFGYVAHDHKRNRWQAVYWVVCYILWKNKNAKVFKKLETVPSLFNEVQVLSYDWISRRCKGHNMDWLQWFSHP